MPTVRIKEALAGQPAIGTEITVRGWVRTRRDSKAGFSFINVHDGSCFDAIQVVAPAELDNYEHEVKKLTTGCAVICTGTLVESGGRGQKYEIQGSEVEVVGWVEDPDTYPIQPKPHSFEFLREVAHLRPRTNTFGAITRVRHVAAQAIHRYFHERGYYWINTPIITASDAEGAGDMFRVSTLDMMNLPRTEQGGIDYSQDFFGRETFLTVSGQLNVEGYCLAMSNVYTFGPTFRAENSNTSRHLAEFWMVEPEIAFANLDDLADLAERVLGNVLYMRGNADEASEMTERLVPIAERLVSQREGEPVLGCAALAEHHRLLRGLESTLGISLFLVEISPDRLPLVYILTALVAAPVAATSVSTASRPSSSSHSPYRPSSLATSTP